MEKRNRVQLFSKVCFSLLIATLSQVMPCQAAVVDRIVVVVNDGIITQSELLERLDPIYAQYQTVYQGNELALKLDSARRDILDQLIQDRLVLGKARELGMVADLGDVEERIREVRGKFSSDQEFEKTLEEQSLNLSDLRQKYADQILIQRLIGVEVKARVSVAPREVREYYHSHPEEYKRPEKVRVRMILIKRPRVTDETTEEQIKTDEAFVSERVEHITQILAEGSPFDEVCRQYSEGPNTEEGGDLGFIERGEMREEIDLVIFSLEVGGQAGPIESPIGYHFFKVNARQEAYLYTFDDVRDEIEDKIYQGKFHIALGEWVEELKNDAFISIK
jgi:peptidyl-prolyl cis-trans isomerase SurA